MRLWFPNLTITDVRPAIVSIPVKKSTVESTKRASAAYAVNKILHLRVLLIYMCRKDI